MLKFSGYSYLIWDQVILIKIFLFYENFAKINHLKLFRLFLLTGKFYPILIIKIRKISILKKNLKWNNLYRCKTLITIKIHNDFYENILLILKQTYFFSKLKKCNMRSKIRWFTYSAIHTTYRILLRSSSLREPRDPLSKVVFIL